MKIRKTKIKYYIVRHLDVKQIKNNKKVTHLVPQQRETHGCAAIFSLNAHKYILSKHMYINLFPWSRSSLFIYSWRLRLTYSTDNKYMILHERVLIFKNLKNENFETTHTYNHTMPFINIFCLQMHISIPPTNIFYRKQRKILWRSRSDTAINPHFCWTTQMTRESWKIPADQKYKYHS